MNFARSAKRFHSYASRIGSKTINPIDGIDPGNYKKFPFIRFTNWKQVPLLKREKIPVEVVFVSIHTLHELEASVAEGNVQSPVVDRFPFIRFTNWKQEQRP